MLGRIYIDSFDKENIYIWCKVKGHIEALSSKQFFL